MSHPKDGSKIVKCLLDWKGLVLYSVLFAYFWFTEK